MDSEKIKNLEIFNTTKYENISLDYLIMYAVGRLEKISVDLSFENMVVTSFMLFPKKFSLLGFPEYPDANRVEKCLWRLTSKRKQWLGGKSHQGFHITDRSRTFIKEAERLLEGISSKKVPAHSQTRRKESLLAEALSSAAYSKYTSGHGDLITEAEFCFLLQGTLDSSRNTLKENLVSLKTFAEDLKYQDVLSFLCWTEKHFEGFLEKKEK